VQCTYLETNQIVICILNIKLTLDLVFIRDTTNSTEKFRGIYTVGWNFRRKRPNTVG
jgi:hypothetical protein